MTIFCTLSFLHFPPQFLAKWCSKSHNEIYVQLITLIKDMVQLNGKELIILNIGYARVSTGLQNLDLQEDSLKKYGCEKIFTDHLSGSKSKRPGLAAAIDYARAGDKIVVWRLDRLGRNMEDLISLVNRLNEQGVSFHSTQENITMDKSSSTGQLIFHLFAAFAEFERNLILERSAAGRAAARARGRFGGRPEKLTQQDLELLKTLVDNGTPIKTIADKWNISRTTVYRYLEKMEKNHETK